MGGGSSVNPENTRTGPPPAASAAAALGASPKPMNLQAGGPHASPSSIYSEHSESIVYKHGVCSLMGVSLADAPAYPGHGCVCVWGGLGGTKRLGTKRLDLMEAD